MLLPDWHVDRMWALISSYDGCAEKPQGSLRDVILSIGFGKEYCAEIVVASLQDLGDLGAP